jgi:UDPglucose--hexose-1-phosphate uridylyltransferase
MTSGFPASLLTTPHRRYNPLLDEWVLCSPQRLDRPWQGQVEPGGQQDPQGYDPGCYLCPGNARAGGRRNPDYADVWAFDNDFPALTADGERDPQADGGRPSPRSGDLFIAEEARGVCRVLCFSPQHDMTLARMPPPAIELVVDAWAAEVERFARRGDFAHVQIFENKGAAMGASSPHPHCQIWATAHVPVLAQRRLETQRRYFSEHGRDLLGDYLDRELTAGDRVVCANEDWVALVPFWAVWPFETMVVPRRAVPDLPSLTGRERGALASLLSRLLIRYDNLFQCAFPYSMGWHGQPIDPTTHPGWRVHASFLPPLLRSSTVRKFLVGYELMAEAQRDLTAEQAAARLRDMSERHYLDRVV